jgi:hypothetical protein
MYIIRCVLQWILCWKSFKTIIAQNICAQNMKAAMAQHEVGLWMRKFNRLP